MEYLVLSKIYICIFFVFSDFSNDGSAEDLSKRNLNRVLRQLPEKGDFDLNHVLDSVYFFS